MSPLAIQPREGLGQRIVRELAGFVGDLRDTLLAGPRLLRLAPAIALLVIVPEFLQHLVEIRLGMFASREAFKAHQWDHLRIGFGIVKEVGHWSAIFASAAFYGARYRLRGWRQGILWKRFGLALALNVAAAFLTWPLQGRVPPLVDTVISSAVGLASLPLILFLIGALLGDEAMTLSYAYRRGWLRLPGIVLLGAAAIFIPQYVHHLDHTLAMGQPLWLVLALMAWDALWVGMMAGWLGGALAYGYGRPERVNDGQSAPLAIS